VNPVLYVVITADSAIRQSVRNCDYFKRRIVFIGLYINQKNALIY